MNNLTVGHKLILIIVSISFLSVLSAFMVMSYAQVKHYKNNLIDETDAITSLISDNLVSSLAFEDKQRAQSILNSTSSHNSIIAACVYDKANKLFASYNREDQETKCNSSINKTFELESSNLVIITKSITQRNKDYGEVILFSELSRLNAFIVKQFLYSAGLLLFVIVTLSFPLARLFQKIISHPINNILHQTSALTTQYVGEKEGKYLQYNELEQLQNMFVSIAGFIETREKKISDLAGQISSLDENTNMTLNLLENEAERISLMLEFSHYYLEKRKNQKLDNSSIEIMKTNAQHAKEFEEYIKEIHQLSPFVSKDVKTGKALVDLEQIISDQYKRVFGEKHGLIDFELYTENASECFLYPSIFSETINNIFLIFKNMTFRDKKYKLKIKIDYSPQVYSNGLTTICFDLAPKYTSAESSEFLMEEEYYLIKLFKAKYLNNLNAPYNSSSSVIIDINPKVFNLQINIPHSRKMNEVIL